MPKRALPLQNARRQLERAAGRRDRLATAPACAARRRWSIAAIAPTGRERVVATRARAAPHAARDVASRARSASSDGGGGRVCVRRPRPSRDARCSSMPAAPPLAPRPPSSSRIAAKHEEARGRVLERAAPAEPAHARIDAASDSSSAVVAAAGARDEPSSSCRGTRERAERRRARARPRARAAGRSEGLGRCRSCSPRASTRPRRRTARRRGAARAARGRRAVGGAGAGRARRELGRRTRSARFSGGRGAARRRRRVAALAGGRARARPAAATPHAQHDHEVIAVGELLRRGSPRRRARARRVDRRREPRARAGAADELRERLRDERCGHGVRASSFAARARLPASAAPDARRAAPRPGPRTRALPLGWRAAAARDAPALRGRRARAAAAKARPPSPCSSRSITRFSRASSPWACASSLSAARSRTHDDGWSAAPERARRRAAWRVHRAAPLHTAPTVS